MYWCWFLCYTNPGIIFFPMKHKSTQDWYWTPASYIAYIIPQARLWSQATKPCFSCCSIWGAWLPCDLLLQLTGGSEPSQVPCKCMYWIQDGRVQMLSALFQTWPSIGICLLLVLAGHNPEKFTILDLFQPPTRTNLAAEVTPGIGRDTLRV